MQNVVAASKLHKREQNWQIPGTPLDGSVLGSGARAETAWKSRQSETPMDLILINSLTARIGASAARKPAAPIQGGTRKPMHCFPKDIRDPRYAAWRPDYKWAAHGRWDELLGR